MAIQWLMSLSESRFVVKTCASIFRPERQPCCGFGWKLCNDCFTVWGSCDQTMVNGQPFMPPLDGLFQAQGKSCFVPSLRSFLAAWIVLLGGSQAQIVFTLASLHCQFLGPNVNFVIEDPACSAQTIVMPRLFVFIAGYIANYCEPSTQSWGKTSIRMATACEKGGQETKHMGHKDWGIYEVEAVGRLAKRCRAQPCVVGAINAWVCTICPRQIAAYSHICACALKRARHWRVGLTFDLLCSNGKAPTRPNLIKWNKKRLKWVDLPPRFRGWCWERQQSRKQHSWIEGETEARHWRNASPN